MTKLLFCTGEGLGNVTQTIPVIRTLKEVLNVSVDFWHVFGNFRLDKFIPYVDSWYKSGEINTAQFAQYTGLVATHWVGKYINNIPLRVLAIANPLSFDRSEVDTYMDIARQLGVEEDSIVWHGNALYDNVDININIVLHNGYNPYGSANWSVKSYPYYKELAKLLIKDGFKVASIGAKHEYIDGTINLTGKPLLTTLGIIKKTKLFISNDTGTYHCANALEVPNIAIFTATSITKNYDRRFHKYSTLIYREDLDCRPCQPQRRWNKDCKKWECRDIDPLYIYYKAKEFFK